MPRGRKLFWTIIGSARSCGGGSNSTNPSQSWHAAKSSLFARGSLVARASHFGQSKLSSWRACPVVIPRTSSTSSFSYIVDLTPSSNLGELVYPGPVKIYGSIYPKSISFSCDNGDLSAFPAVYMLKHNARRFEATVGIEAQWPSDYLVGVSLLGDGRTLLTFSVSVLKPKTVDVNVHRGPYPHARVLHPRYHFGGQFGEHRGSVGKRTCD